VSCRCTEKLNRDFCADDEKLVCMNFTQVLLIRAYVAMSLK